MKEFTYTIADKAGLHARPAGLLVKECENIKSTVTVENCDTNKSCDGTKLFALMGLAIKYDTKVKVSIEGSDEEYAYEALMSFFKNNL